MKNIKSQKRPSHWIEAIEADQAYREISVSDLQRLVSQAKKRYQFYRTLKRYVQAGDCALEVGCGWAISSFALAEDGALVMAMDLSPRLIENLRKVQAEWGAPYSEVMNFECADIRSLSKADKRFDVVFSDGLYEHFLDPAERSAMLNNCRTLLKSQGKLLIAVPNLKNPFFGGVVSSKMPDMACLSVEDLRSELRSAGFQILETGYSFVNPGFSQWLQGAWMKPFVKGADFLYEFIPMNLKRIVAAHIYCVAQKK